MFQPRLKKNTIKPMAILNSQKGLAAALDEWMLWFVGNNGSSARV